ncbi:MULTISPECIES: CBS domain-containing protein [Haloprofundus]|uniref:CBS domain-containing protein n=1 Tax=Haloprofundus TaxID=1911573 RepID=UPI000E44611E|nr:MULTISPECIES: CBS domain-containing protein [Haloprofundus]QCJ45663.1 CBS domain-containing protein [Haloprofundus sp. MHR1]
MTLSDILDATVATAAPTTPVGDVTAAMREGSLELVAVLDEQRPLGLLTPADIGRAYVAGEDLDGETAGEILSDDLVTVRESEDLSALVAHLADENARRAAVVDDAGDFVGVVRLEDALVQYGEDLTRILSMFDG